MSNSFSSWTEYDNWLVQNYDKYSICKIDESDGKITAEYCEKSEFPKIKEEYERKKS